ncbi:MAG: hypothetical protein R3F23_01920 [Verrucomicrobiia bacterium]
MPIKKQNNDIFKIDEPALNQLKPEGIIKVKDLVKMLGVDEKEFERLNPKLANTDIQIKCVGNKTIGTFPISEGEKLEVGDISIPANTTGTITVDDKGIKIETSNKISYDAPGPINPKISQVTFDKKGVFQDSDINIGEGKLEKLLNEHSNKIADVPKIMQKNCL